MKRAVVFLTILVSSYAVLSDAVESGHFQPLQIFIMRDVPKGPYCDHLAIDLAGHRLFATPQAAKRVDVLDLDSGKLLHSITGLANPHSVLYRSDVDRLFITDGGEGKIKIYDSKNYRPVATIDGLPDADSIGYDPVSKELFVTNGGESVKEDFAFLSVIDTTKNIRIANIKIPAGALEAMVLEKSGPLLYLDMMDQNKIAVINRKTHQLLHVWPITKGHKNIAIALDEAHHRLFVGCRDSEASGTIVVLDTNTGREIETLPIKGWVDYLIYDAKSRRLYASSGAPVPDGGAIFAFQQSDETYTLLATSLTAPRAKTGLYVPELGKMFVAVPHFEDDARILVYKVP